jgi:hypothetical protein
METRMAGLDRMAAVLALMRGSLGELFQLKYERMWELLELDLRRPLVGDELSEVILLRAELYDQGIVLAEANDTGPRGF